MGIKLFLDDVRDAPPQRDGFVASMLKIQSSRGRILQPKRRALEKEASRLQDMAELRAGVISLEDLNKRNGIFHGMKFRIMWERIRK